MSDEQVAIVGRGRFGQVLEALARRAGLVVTTHDKGDPPPPASSTLVVLAVPLDAVAEVAAQVARGGALLLDVTSVKVEAERALASLPPSAPWCATHPLFGPQSATDALRAVVCPNPAHPTAAPRARAFYEKLGCAVQEMTAEAHDRLLAETQAIAFFLGDGLRAAGLGERAPWGPPSAEALHRLAFGVTKEGGHVKHAILAKNPYAMAARERLLAALTATRDALGDAPGETTALDGLRAHIDGLDAQLVELLAVRSQVARKISRAKAALGLPVQDPAREATALADRRAHAARAGVDGAFIEAIFLEIMHWSRALQESDRRP